MSQGDASEYRVLLQRLSHEPAATLAPPQFTAIIHAVSADDAIREAEKLAALFEGTFRVVDIRPNHVLLE